MVPNSWLTLESPLNPFKRVEHGKERPYTSLDCINIEKQLGYTYSLGSLEEAPVQAAGAGGSSKVVHVSGINRAPIRGSFLVSVFGNIGGKKVHLGTEAVLSRWSVQYCANYQTHLEVKAFVGLHAFQDELLDSASYEVESRTRDGVLTESPSQAPPVTGLAAMAAAGKRLFRIEVR